MQTLRTVDTFFWHFLPVSYLCSCWQTQCHSCYLMRHAALSWGLPWLLVGTCSSDRRYQPAVVTAVEKLSLSELSQPPVRHWQRLRTIFRGHLDVFEHSWELLYKQLREREFSQCLHLTGSYIWDRVKKYGNMEKCLYNSPLIIKGSVFNHLPVLCVCVCVCMRVKAYGTRFELKYPSRCLHQKNVGDPCATPSYLSLRPHFELLIIVLHSPIILLWTVKQG
jgi:hypothetical protein